MKIAIALLIRFCTVDNLCAVAARIISAILLWASKRGGSRWESAKGAVKKIKTWCELFDQVYEDDEMSADEEKMVADAIRRETPVEKIVEILQKQGPEKLG